MASRPSHLPALRTRRWEAMPSSGMLASAGKGPVKDRPGSGGQVMQGDPAAQLYQPFIGLVHTPERARGHG